eukprot:SAG11_NODE_649_length_7940_cov_12.287973_3_plen_138_part_00
MVTDVVKSNIVDHCGPQFKANSPPESLNARVLKKDVLAAKKYLKNACVSPVDKGAGRLAIKCPAVQHAVMAKSWPDESERCTILCESSASEEEFAKVEMKIMTEDIQTYHEEGWDAIAKLYGVDTQGRPTKCGLPQV